MTTEREYRQRTLAEPLAPEDTAIYWRAYNSGGGPMLAGMLAGDARSAERMARWADDRAKGFLPAESAQDDLDASEAVLSVLLAREPRP